MSVANACNCPASSSIACSWTQRVSPSGAARSAALSRRRMAASAEQETGSALLTALAHTARCTTLRRLGARHRGRPVCPHHLCRGRSCVTHRGSGPRDVRCRPVSTSPEPPYGACQVGRATEPQGGEPRKVAEPARLGHILLDSATFGAIRPLTKSAARNIDVDARRGALC